MTANDLRTFVFGMMAGIALLICSFVLVSELYGLRWQPVTHSHS